MRALLLIGSAAGALGAGALAVYLWRRKTQAPARKMSAETAQNALVKNPPKKPKSKVPPVKGMSVHDLAHTANFPVDPILHRQAILDLMVMDALAVAHIRSQTTSTADVLKTIGKVGLATAGVVTQNYAITAGIIADEIKNRIGDKPDKRSLHDALQDAFLTLNHKIRVSPGASRIGVEYAPPYDKMGSFYPEHAQYKDTVTGTIFPSAAMQAIGS